MSSTMIIISVILQPYRYIRSFDTTITRYNPSCHTHSAPPPLFTVIKQESRRSRLYFLILIITINTFGTGKDESPKLHCMYLEQTLKKIKEIRKENNWYFAPQQWTSFKVTSTHRCFLLSYTSKSPRTWGWSTSFMMAISLSTWNKKQLVVHDLIQLDPAYSNSVISNSPLFRTKTHFFFRLLYCACTMTTSTAQPSMQKCKKNFTCYQIQFMIIRVQRSSGPIAPG